MKKLKNFEFREAGPKSTYDWDTILSGAVLQLEDGVDYKCKKGTFVYLLKRAAERRGQTIRYNSVEGGIVLQASAPESNGQTE